MVPWFILYYIRQCVAIISLLGIFIIACLWIRRDKTDVGIWFIDLRINNATYYISSLAA